MNAHIPQISMNTRKFRELSTNQKKVLFTHYVKKISRSLTTFISQNQQQQEQQKTQKRQQQKKE